jgi:hypothetical protein
VPAVPLREVASERVIRDVSGGNDVNVTNVEHAEVGEMDEVREPEEPCGQAPPTRTQRACDSLQPRPLDVLHAFPSLFGACGDL